MNSTNNKSLKEIIKECAESSTSHGIPNISRNPNWFLKVIWILSFIASFSYCAYLLTRSVHDFLDYDVITQIKNERLSSIEFPTVTFCNKNPYKFVYSEDFRNFTQSLKTYFTDENTIRYFNDSIGLMGFFYYSTSYLYYASFASTSESRLLTSYTIDEMLINCRFNNKKCTKNDFEYFYTTNFGNCYKFNSGKNMIGEAIPIEKVYSPGKYYALNLELFMGYEDPENDLIRSTGAQIFVHNSSWSPLTNIEGISMSTGFETDLVINQVFYTKLSNPYGDCITDSDSYGSDIYNITVNMINKYSQKYCLQFCYQKYIIDQCDCYDLTVPDYNISRPCFLTDGECFSNAINAFYASIQPSCFKKCPSECNSIKYNLQLFQSDFPSLFYSELLIKYNQLYPNSFRNYTTYEQVKKSVLAVNVYYDDITLSYVEEIPAKTAEQFLADIGGIMGLCIGVSFLSFVEIVELIAKVVIQIFISIKSKPIKVNPNLAK